MSDVRGAAAVLGVVFLLVCSAIIVWGTTDQLVALMASLPPGAVFIAYILGYEKT